MDERPDSGGRHAANWEGGWDRGRGYPWAGAILVLLGVAFLLHQLVPALDATALVALALGAALASAWILGRSRLALWVGAILLGYAVARLLVGADVIAGRGWTTLGIGLGLAAGWLASRIRDGAGTWPLLLAALFALVGAAQLAEDQPVVRDAGRFAGPVVVIAIGVLLIASQARRGRGAGS